MKNVPRKQPALIARLMDTLGHKHDANYYLDLFTAQKAESFAMIVVDEDAIAHEFEAFIVDLRYLRELGLFPVLVFRCSQLIWDTLDYHTYFKKMHLKVVPIDYKKSFADDVGHAIAQKAVPILHLRHEVELVPPIVSMVNALKTKKLIILNTAGALHDANPDLKQTAIKLMRLEEFSLRETLLDPDDRALFQHCRDILLHTSHRMHIAITSPLNLLRELFTVKGAGTLIYKGYKIEKYPSLQNLDLPRLEALLESSFSKRLVRKLEAQAIDCIYLEAGYRGAAFIKEVAHMAYLSKFAVGLKARGLGVGRDLWQRIAEDFQKLFWRADPNNFISAWYAKQCTGMHKGPRWTTYWIGLDGEEILKAIRYASAQEEDFEFT